MEKTKLVKHQRNENWPRSLRFEPIFIAGISSNKQAETSTEIQSEPTKSSASASRVDKVPINSTELENNDNGTSRENPRSAPVTVCFF